MSNPEDDQRSLRVFTIEAKDSGINSKSAFVAWFRNVKGGSAAQSRLYEAWQTCQSQEDQDYSHQGTKKRSIDECAQVTENTLTKLIVDYKNIYQSGTFYLQPGESIDRVLTQNDVPNKYGVYIIYSIVNGREELIYLGKAGTITTDGTFKQQGLKGRLKAVHGDVPRKVYFQNVIREYGFDSLKFVWIVTVDSQNIEIPGFAEMRLIQEYFNIHGHLPILNKGA